MYINVCIAWGSRKNPNVIFLNKTTNILKDYFEQIKSRNNMITLRYRYIHTSVEQEQNVKAHF